MFMKIKKNIGRQRGFTLVELLVVVSIIGILAAIAIPNFTSAVEAARAAKIQADLRTIAGAVALYYSDMAGNPADIDTLTKANSSGKGPWLASKPQPPVPGDSYTYNKDTGIASYTYKGVTYSSDGTKTTTTS